MIAVTGAAGRLGSRVLEALLELVPPRELVAVVRSPEEVRRMAMLGIQVRHGDDAQPRMLLPALEGVRRLLLISGTEPSKRVEHHRAVVHAAKTMGVERIAYTSVLRADSSTLPIAGDHRETEELLRRSEVPFVFLRNGWYVESFLENLAQPLAVGAFFGAAHDGRIAAASRADYAAAAANVLTTAGHDGKTYELAGDRAFTMRELAQAVSNWAGKPLPYNDLDASEYRRILTKAHLAPRTIDDRVETDQAIARGDLDSSSHDLHRLIRHHTQTVDELLDALPPPRRGEHGAEAAR